MQSEIKKYKRNYFFIKKKYHFYLSTLSDLLNKIHNIKINKKIWTFLLSLIFMRIVLILNDIYNDFKKNEYNLGNRPGLTLSFNNFNEIYFALITRDQFFLSQLYRVYKNRSISKKSKKFKLKNNSKNEKYSYVKYYFNNFFFLFNNKIFLKFIYIKILSFFIKKKSFLVFGSYFSRINKINLNFKNNNRFKFIKLPAFIYENNNDTIRRTFIRKISIVKKKDNFDIFFYNVLRLYMPKILLESFKKNFQEIKLYLARNQSLKYIVNENFISNQQSSFFIGVAKFVSKIKFLYNEHNSLSHFLFGNNVRIISKLSDYYLTLGWKSNKKNILPFGSLFLYDGVNRNREKKIDVLYLANIFNYIRHTHWNISTIERSLKYKWYEFSFNFFSHIDPHIIKNLKIKNPTDSDLRIGVNTICEKTFNKFFSRKQILTNEFNFKDYLYKSRFVIIDSYWTSHLEAIIANIPFIILKPKNFINYLPSNNAHNILINSKIIYDDPILASKFVNNNYVDYDSWWFSKKVQDARKLFIDQNLKSNEFFINKVKCFE